MDTSTLRALFAFPIVVYLIWKKSRLITGDQTLIIGIHTVGGMYLVFKHQHGGIKSFYKHGKANKK